jgi:hypothetical protein
MIGDPNLATLVVIYFSFALRIGCSIVSPTNAIDFSKQRLIFWVTVPLQEISDHD